MIPLESCGRESMRPAEVSGFLGGNEMQYQLTVVNVRHCGRSSNFAFPLGS